MRLSLSCLLVACCLPLTAGEAFAPCRRARRDPFGRRFVDYAFRVLHPGEVWSVRRNRAQALLKELVALEKKGDIDAARKLAPTAIAAASGYVSFRHCRIFGHDESARLDRNLIERRVLYGRDDLRATPAQFSAYLAAIDAGDRVALVKLAGESGNPLGDHVLVSLAWLRIKEGEFDAAAKDLDECLEKFPATPKRDEITFLASARSLWPQRQLGWHKPKDPIGIDKELAVYLATFPEGRWSAWTRDWRALMRFYQPKAGWTHPAGARAAAAIHYADPLLRPGCGDFFDQAAASVRIVWPKIGVDAAGKVIADPRLALMYAHHLLTNRDDDAPAALDLARQRMTGVTNTHLRCCFVQLLIQAGRSKEAEEVLAATVDDGSAFVEYLYGRLFASLDDLAGATDRWQRLIMLKDEVAGGFSEDLATRIGVLCERQGRWPEALGWFHKANDPWNTSLCAGGEMPLDELLAWIAAHPDVPPDDDGVYQAAACRLVAAGRLDEARRALGEKHRLLADLAKLTTMTEQAGNGTVADRYALAAWWYHRGHDLLMPDKRWANWHFWTWPKPELQGDAVDQVLVERWRERERELVSRNAYLRALPLFAEVAKESTDDELTAKALYSAGTCCWWLRGRNRQLRRASYWRHRNRDGEFSSRGDFFMAELVRRFPSHRLAKTKHARAAAKRVAEAAH